jgi:phage shock protein A
MTKKQCPLGEDCDLTIAWMKGAEDARDKAKARIEALEKEITEVNAAWEQTSIMLGRQLARASDLEAKLAKALEAFDRIAGKAPYADDPYDIARAALAELKGDKP